MKKLTIITAADGSHAAPLRNLLWTIAEHEPAATVIAWDLGLSPDERASLIDEAPASWLGELRTFDFVNRPPHFSMARNAGRLAWRPVVVLDAIREMGGLVLWLDAGCWVRRPLLGIRHEIERRGVYSCSCAGTIGDHLAPSARAALGVKDAALGVSMRDAGVAGFDASNPRAVQLAEAWARASRDPQIMDPPGADRRAHRQDAVFAVLMLAAGFSADGPVPGEVSIKRDKVSLAETQHRLMTRTVTAPTSSQPSPADRAAYARAIAGAARGIR